MSAFIQDTNGQWWKTSVTTDGLLSTEAVLAPEASVEGAFVSDVTADEVLTQVAQDIRNQLPADSTILLNYLNRVHKQVLRSSRWKFMLSAPKQFTTTAGVGSYWLGVQGNGPEGITDSGLNLPDVYCVIRGSVKDRTKFQPIAGTDDAPLGPGWDTDGQPLQWNIEFPTPNVVVFYPAPPDARVIEFRYMRQRAEITATNSLLLVPRDYVDVLVAGVNMYAYEFLKNPSEAQAWASAFRQGLQDMIKDRNTYHSNTVDYIRPAC